MALYTISVFFNSKGFLFFMYLGPAYRQKYKQVTKMVSKGPGEFESNHGFVLGSEKKNKYKNNFTINLFDRMM